MAEIPSSIPLDPVSGATQAGLEGVRPTDFGLGQAAQVAGQAADEQFQASRLAIRAQAVNNKEIVAPGLNALRIANQEDLDKGKAAYTPGAGGLSDWQTAAATARAQQMASNAAYTPGQRAEFMRAAQQETSRVQMEAGTHQAAVDAVPVAEATANAHQRTVTDGVIAADAATAPKLFALKLNSPPGDPMLPANALAIHDQGAAAAVSAAPPDAQPDIAAALQARRLGVYNDATSTMLQGQEGAQHLAVAKQTATAINTIDQAPSNYENVVNTLIPQIVANAPKAWQPAVEREAKQEAAIALVKSLNGHGQYAIAQKRIDAGEFDGVLEPGQLEELKASTDAQARADAPVNVDQALAQNDLQRRAQEEAEALLSTGKSTGRVSEAEIRSGLPADQAAKVLGGWKIANQEFAAAGPIRTMPMAQLTAIANAPVDPTAPDYDIGLLRRQAAQAEVASRTTDPGAWTWADNGKGVPAVKGPGAAASALAQNRGAALQAMYNNVQTMIGQGANATSAAHQYAGSMIGSQAALGLSRDSWALVPTAEAQRLAQTVTTAAPGAKSAAIGRLGALFNALPGAFKLPDGSYANPKVILAHQLLAAHMTPLEMSAALDYAGNTGSLARVDAALADPGASKGLPNSKPGGHDEMFLRNAVVKAISPYNASVDPTPDGALLSQGRFDRTLLVARHLVLSQGMAPDDAAKAAAGDMATGYKYVDTWRIPTAQAGGFGLSGDGANQVRTGAAKLMSTLTGAGGVNGYVPTGQTAKEYAQRVQQNGHWVTAPDDSGLMLMIHNPGGDWNQALDKFSRPVAASWATLKAHANGDTSNPFAAPPANVLHAPDGTPAPVRSKSDAFAALSWGINRTESHFLSGLTSDQGALGQMQVLPQLVKTYAPRLGLPIDMNRALHDDDYNRKIGNAYLADLVGAYGSTPEGMTLAATAYFEGRGNVEGYNDAKGYHPGLLQRIGDPRNGGVSVKDFIDRLPPKGRAYVQAVLPAAAAHLIRGGG